MRGGGEVGGGKRDDGAAWGRIWAGACHREGAGGFVEINLQELFIALDVLALFSNVCM